MQIWCKKVQTRSKSKAKMVNTAFACQFTWGCKFKGKAFALFYTKFALSKFDVNQIFRAVSVPAQSLSLRFIVYPSIATILSGFCLQRYVPEITPTSISHDRKSAPRATDARTLFLISLIETTGC